MSAGEAPGGIIMAIGSPGTTRSSTKTITATPASVGGMRTSRLMISPQRIVVPPYLTSLSRCDQLRKNHPVGLRHDLQALFMDDRLHILEKRDHLALLRDVFVDGLPAGDPLGFVLFAPQWADALDEILALPGAMRRRAEHRKAGGGGGIADRVAPIVERRRRERMARAQLEMLRDFVDLDIGFDPDLAPHPDDRLDHLVILRLEPARRLDRELDRLFRREAALGQQAFGQFRIVGNLDRGIEGGVARRFQGRDRNAVALQQPVDDRLLVDRVKTTGPAPDR